MSAVTDLAEPEVGIHSSDRRHDRSQDSDVQGAWVGFGCEHRSLKIDRNFECKIRAAEALCEPAESVSKSSQGNRSHEEE